MDLKKTPKDVCFTKINLWNIFICYPKARNDSREVILNHFIKAFTSVKTLFSSQIKTTKTCDKFHIFTYPHIVYMFIVFNNKIKENGLKTLY